MQLAPVLMALRDSVGLERVVVDTYQSVSGTGADALAELEGPDPRARRPARPRSRRVYPHPIAFNALPEIDVFLAQRLHEGGVEGRHREPQDPPPARTCGSRARPSASRSSSATRRRSTSRRASRSRPERARELFAAVPGVIVQDDPADARLPAGDRGRRARRDLRRAGPARHRRSRTIAASRSGSSPTTCARARRRTPSSSPRSSRARTGSSPPRPAARSRIARRVAPRPRRDRRRAPGGARGRSPPRSGSARTAVCTRRGRRPSRVRATPTPRSSSSARARASTRTAQGRPFVGRAGDLLVKLLGSIGWQPRGRVHHERREVPAARTTATRSPTRSRPARRTCAASSRSSIRPSSSPLGRYSMATFMPGRADLAGARHRPAGRSRRPAPRDALVFAMYHPAAALRTPAIERESYADIAAVPAALIDSRRRREATPSRRPPRPTRSSPSAPAAADAATARHRARHDSDRRQPSPPRRPRPPTTPTPQLTLF